MTNIDDVVQLARFIGACVVGATAGLAFMISAAAFFAPTPRNFRRAIVLILWAILGAILIR